MRCPGDNEAFKRWWAVHELMGVLKRWMGDVLKEPA